MSPRAKADRSPADNRQLSELSARFRAPLQSYFQRRIGSRHDTDDLVQEVFVRLARTGDLAAISHLEGYLFEVAANVLRDQGRYRHSRRFAAHDAYEENQHALEDFSPERVLIGRQSIGMVAHALREVPERVRVAFVLHRFEGLKHPEIAARLGVSVSAVEKYVMQALVHIKKRMSEQP